MIPPRRDLAREALEKFQSLADEAGLHTTVRFQRRAKDSVKCAFCEQPTGRVSLVLAGLVNQHKLCAVVCSYCARQTLEPRPKAPRALPPPKGRATVRGGRRPL